MMANNRIPSGPNTPGSQQTPTHQGIKIFIQRDYSEGTAVKFQTRFPPELEDRVWSDFKNNTKKKAAHLHRKASGTGGGPAVFAKLSDLEQRVLNLMGLQVATGLAVEEAGLSQIDRQTFEYTMERLNEHFEMAETADCSTYCEGCLACLTAYFIYICTETHYEKHLRKVSKFIATQNERVYNPRGIHITDPILRGLRVIEITVIDIPNCQSPTGNSNNQMRHT